VPTTARRSPEDHDRRRECVHLHALLTQRSKEARAELQADGEHEQDQSELLHEIERVMIHRMAEMPDENPREDLAAVPSPMPRPLQAAECHAGHAHEGERAHGVRNGLRFVEFEDPVMGQVFGEASDCGGSFATRESSEPCAWR
jgi:hypothetical protein